VVVLHASKRARIRSISILELNIENIDYFMKFSLKRTRRIQTHELYRTVIKRKEDKEGKGREGIQMKMPDTVIVIIQGGGRR
jgi:hypothetical protein